jgi:hypothetical protein
MSITGISSSPLPMQRPQANGQAAQRAHAQSFQLQSNGLPKSPLAPSSKNEAGQTLSHAVSQRLLDLQM